MSGFCLSPPLPLASSGPCPVLLPLSAHARALPAHARTPCTAAVHTRPAGRGIAYLSTGDRLAHA
eukprot:68571-Rhodomonas_salina.1